MSSIYFLIKSYLRHIYVSELQSSLSSSDKTSSTSILSSFTVPSLIVSMLMNLMAGGFMLSTYLSPATSREDTEPTQFYQFIPPYYQDPTGQEYQPEEESPAQDKMGRLAGMRLEYLNGKNAGDSSKEEIFDNMYLEDIYHNLPRSLY